LSFAPGTAWSSELANRIVPWSRVEIINVLPGRFDVENAKLAMDDGGSRLLKADGYACPIMVARESRY
jgi:hypothetical protein